MNLKPFEATISEGCIRMTVEVWSATEKAARESAAAYAREEGMRNPTIYVKSLDKR